jgi:FAD:protein FMN transferase
VIAVENRSGFQVPFMTCIACMFFLLSCSDKSGSTHSETPIEAPNNLSINGQSSGQHYVELSYRLMGTKASVAVYAEDPDLAKLHIEEVFKLAADIELVCSDYKVTSELARFNALTAGIPFKTSETLWEVLQMAQSIHKKTAGRFDPSVGIHTFQWRLIRLEQKLPSPEEIAKNKAAAGWHLLQFESNTSGNFIQKAANRLRIDLGGIAKGYAVDKMFDLLASQGYRSFSITFGGDVRVANPPPGSDGWKVRVMKYAENGEISTDESLSLVQAAISTSGDIHQFIDLDGVRYSHIIDARTGLGMTERVTATVIAPSSTLADAYATAACLSADFAKELGVIDKISVSRVALDGKTMTSLLYGVFSDKLSQNEISEPRMNKNSH